MGADAFAALLRAHRVAAGLTQEALAARCGLSAQAVSLLERGARRLPRPQTVALLVDALRLPPAQADALRAAVQRAAPASGATAAAMRTLPRPVAAFTGRDREVSHFLTALSTTARTDRAVPIGAIDGMAGVGKTAFAVHVAHRVAADYPDGQLFLDLRGHVAGQQPVSPGDALRSLLLSSGVSARLVPRDVESRAGMWRDRVAGKRVLILLDDAVSHDQVRHLLPGAAGCLVVITSRRRLAALEDVESLTLRTLTPAHSARLLTRLIRARAHEADPAAVEEVVQRCGYLPLAIVLVAGRLRSHPSWTVRHLADLLCGAQDRLVELRAEDVAVRAAFDLSYEGLSSDGQRLFRRLGLHPGPELDAYAAAALDGGDLARTRQRLDALHADHLVEEPRPGRYQLHDLLRVYARSLPSREDAGAGDAATERLVEYYLHTCAIASRYIAQHTDSARPSVTHAGSEKPDLPTVRSALAWLDAERPNLIACFDRAIASGRPDMALAISEAVHPFLHFAGHWEEALAVHRAAVDAARRSGDPLREAGALNDLAIVQRVTDQHQAAAVSATGAAAIARDRGDALGEANALGTLGGVRLMAAEYAAATDAVTAALRLFEELGDPLGRAGALHTLGVIRHVTEQQDAARTSLAEALALYQGACNPRGQASTLYYLGNVQRLTGAYPMASASLAEALALLGELGDRLGQANVLAGIAHVQRVTGEYRPAIVSLAEALAIYRDLGSRFGQANALQAMGSVQRLTGDHRAAGASLTEALELYRDLGNRHGQANALHELGAVHRLAGRPRDAVESLDEALTIYRDVGSRIGEANVLHELGLVRGRTDARPAVDSLTAALALFRDAGDRHGQAEVLNSLGTMMADSDVDGALSHHGRALRLARAIRSPLEEARALEGIGRCLLRARRTVEGIDHLRRALTIYGRLEVPEAERTAATLTGLGSSVRS